jgi:hypothetical protein
MRLRIFLIVSLSITSVVLSGCSTLDPQSSKMAANPPSVDRNHYIEEVPFIKQNVAQCGPATLAMVLSYRAHAVSVDELARSVLTESKGGTLQSALVGGARREGLMAVPVTGFAAMIREIAGGNPVIALQNLGLSWWPKWHYVVVTGYDLDSKTLRIHSGAEKNRKISFKDFEIDWSPAHYWGLVVVPACQLSESGNEFDHVTSAAILESLNKSKEAEDSYIAILKRWPQSLGAMLGLGNIYYASARYGEAQKILEKAKQFHPDSAAASHNYEIARKKNQSFDRSLRR